MLTHNKVPLLPRRYPAQAEVERIFERARALEEKR
jgi:hypothetical protein